MSSEEVSGESSNPQVSVIIPYYKAAEWLPMQLNALASQTDPPSFEVIIADNGGSAELPGVIAPFRGQLDLRIIDATARPGCGAARNQGVNSARAECLAFCDADDIVEPYWLSSISHPVIDSDVLAAGALRLDRINREYVWRTAMKMKSDDPSQPPILQVPFKDFDYKTFSYGGNTAIRRSSFFRVGGFGEDFPHGGEDIDFSWKCSENGVPVIVVPKAVIDYRLRRTSRDVFRQHFSYGRAEVDIWITSRDANRAVRGMSLKWTVSHCLRLPAEALRSLRASEAERYRFAADAGDLLGNLQGQMERRIMPELRRRLHWHRPGSSEAVQ